VADFLYSLEASRFRDPVTGRFVAEKTVRDWTDAVADKAGDRMAGIAKQLQSGGIDLAEFQTRMMAEVKQVHVATALAAHGGKAATSQADYGFIGSQVKNQYGYLDQWARDLASGDAPITERALLARARLYADSAVGTYEATRGRDARLRGYTEERNILDGAADHCGQCPGLSARGWVPLDSLPPVGSRNCRAKDRCRMERRRAGERAA